ncbi:uncharacterized protein METZ01_LOCUS105234 [marine metagenome]|jgi:hypothetical protein|uniref:Uncharacterized protein n=1 Tax=marine metagenome TaxID=408172 RepID=A0A381WIQ5_9ZZZZ|tara:strand:- start:1308 stop:1577 length:270 start_codon:yes stop_codon:yes gene_type:complete
MKHFINIVWEKKVDDIDGVVADAVIECADEALLEDETNYLLGETDKGGLILTVETHKPLKGSESTVVAERIANKLFDLGYNHFDVEISV